MQAVGECVQRLPGVGVSVPRTGVMLMGAAVSFVVRVFVALAVAAAPATLIAALLAPTPLVTIAEATW